MKLRPTDLPQRVYGGLPLRSVPGPPFQPEDRAPAYPLDDRFVRAKPPRLIGFDPPPRIIDPTVPTPLIDLSDKRFTTLIRPDGRWTKMEEWGDIVYPDKLIPGGVEMPALVLSGTSVVLNVFGDSGKGTPDQFEVARNISAMAEKRNARVTLHLGDIVYPAGILTADDPRIDELVRKPYASLLNRLICWGNHEYGNGNTAGVPEAWLEAAKSDKPGTFKQGARFYSQRIVLDDFAVRVVMMDTSTIAVDPAQLAWVRGQCEAGAEAGEIVLVGGHHPVYSGGMHGSIPHMEKLVLPILEQFADLSLAGHEHNLQFLTSANGFPCVVSGAAGEHRAAWRKPQSEFYSGNMGTTFLNVDKNGITVTMVDGKTREVLFTRLIPRRQKKCRRPKKSTRRSARADASSGINQLERSACVIGTLRTT